MSESDVREELFEAIHALSDAGSGMRLGQLLAAAGEVCADLHGRSLWDAEDREFLEAVWKFQRDLESSLPAKAQPNA